MRQDDDGWRADFELVDSGAAVRIYPAKPLESGLVFNLHRAPMGARFARGKGMLAGLLVIETLAGWARPDPPDPFTFHRMRPNR